MPSYTRISGPRQIECIGHGWPHDISDGEILERAG